MGRKPDFIGIGAQRAGTSWIYACLFEHPSLCLPNKELNFFSRARNWNRGIEWYETQFEECDKNQLTGEYSTSYLADKRTPERIHEHYPDTQLIVSLRDPIERAYSSYRNDIVDGQLDTDVAFKQALDQNSKYIDWGRYATHLDRYTHFFDREQLLILVYEESLADPAAFIQRIFSFMGVDSNFKPSMLEQTVNPGYQPRYPWLDSAINNVSDFLRSSRWMRPLWWGIKNLGIGQALRGLNSDDSGQDHSISSEIREKLMETYRDEINRLESDYNLSLEHWKRED